MARKTNHPDVNDPSGVEWAGFQLSELRLMAMGTTPWVKEGATKEYERRTGQPIRPYRPSAEVQALTAAFYAKAR